MNLKKLDWVASHTQHWKLAVRGAAGALVGLAISHCAVSSHAVVIDTFTDSAFATAGANSTGWKKHVAAVNGVSADLTLANPLVLTSDSAATGAFGGQRDGRAFHSAGTGNVSSFVPNSPNGTIQISSGANDVGSITYQYDAFSGYDANLNDANGNLNLNLASDPFLYIQLAIDPGMASGETLDIGMFSNTGGVMQTIFGIPVNSPYIQVPLSSFNLVNLGDIDRINFTFHVTGGSDLIIQEIGTELVPEPHTIAIWGIIAAVASLAGWRRRRTTVRLA